VRADRSEPLERDGLIAKLGIDATRRVGDRPDWTRAAPPAAAMEKARRLLENDGASAPEQDRVSLTQADP
jgi:hypothetical protein